MANFQVDLALHSFFQEDSPFEVDNLFSDHFVVAARKGHPAAAKRLTRKAYLAAEHILVTREAEPPIRLESNFTRLGHVRKVVLKVPLYLPAPETASQSDRLLTIPQLLAVHYGRHLPLRIHPLPFPRVDFQVSLISHPTASRDPVCSG